jgi:hypothetical protein
MSKRIAGLFILAGLLMPVAARADSAAWGFTPGSEVSSTSAYTVGTVFTANQSIMVDALGYFDPNDATLSGSHQVDLFNLTTGGAAIASATISSSSSDYFQNFLYVALGSSSVELIAGDQYVIEAVTGTSGDYYTHNVIGFSTNLPITVNGYNYQTGTQLASGDGVTNQTALFGPDFGGYTVTPEPSTLLLLGSGLAGLAGLIKRKLAA